MTKVLGIILIVCVLGGGGWYYMNNVKQDTSAVAEGEPVAASVQNPFKVTFPKADSVIKIGQTFNVTWTISGSGISTSTVYKLFLKPELGGATIEMGSVPAFNKTFNYTIKNELGLRPGKYKIMFNSRTVGGESSVFTVASSTSNDIITSSFFNGPSVKPAYYTLTKKGDSIPKIKINCPSDVYVFDSDKEMINMGDGNINHVCNKFVLMKFNFKNDGKNLYIYMVNFINQSTESKTVSAEVEVDGKIIKMDQNLNLPSTNSNTSEMPKG
jgi:hypothetical protein